MRHRSPGHDHGIYTTVIEELFIALCIADWARTNVWEPMKKTIDDAFANHPKAGGTVFLEKLKDIWTKRPNLKVTLIAHSAGSIFIQRFIEAMDASFGPQPQKVEVITMAAAVSFERMWKGLAQLQKRVSAVRVFGLNAALEGGYWEVFPIYDKSLLFIVCSLCEGDPDADKPLFGMQRYWTACAAIGFFVRRSLAISNSTTSPRSSASRPSSNPDTCTKVSLPSPS